MTLNGVMTVTLRYLTEFGKPALQKTICGGIYARVYCIFSVCTMLSQSKFTFAISSPDEFFVILLFCMQVMGSETLSVEPVTALPLDTRVYDDQVRFVCMSDTHCNAAYFADILPPGDVFLHAGDFTCLGMPHEVEEFNAFLGNKWHCP